MEVIWNQLPASARLFIMVSAAVVVVIAIAAFCVKRLLYVCPPNQVLIFSGRSRTGSDGRKIGFRTVHGGRAWRVPILEQVAVMDLTNMSVPMTVSGAYSEGTDGKLGIPLTVHAVANVKISSDPRFLGNAIERFLGRAREELARVAKETLEGHLRGVLATMTPEDVNEDRLKFAQRLRDEAEPDLEKLGLHMDTLKIQHVSDDRNYLESIGRRRIAEIIRAAEVAESDASRAASELEAAAKGRSDVAETKAKTAIVQKENQLRQFRAELWAAAKSEEEKATAAAQEARAHAEKELQEIRAGLEELRLAADVTIPAEIARQVQELDAAGHAAHIAEDGRARALALEEISSAWAESEGRAMDIHVLQNLEEIFGQVVDAARNMKVREVNLVDGGDGKTLSSYASAYPATVAALLDQVSSSLGVDVKRIIAGGAPTTVSHPSPPAADGRSSQPEGGRAW